MRIRWSYFISRSKLTRLLLIVTFSLNIYILSNIFLIPNVLQRFPDLLLSNKCEFTGNGVISSYGSGKLGNRIFQYLSMLSIAEEFHLHVYLPPETSNKMSTVFEKIFIPKIETYGSDCHWINEDNFKDVRKELKNLNHTYGLADIVKIARKCNRAILVRENAIFVQTIMRFINKIRSRCQYKRQLLDFAQEKLHAIVRYTRSKLKNETIEMVFVGLHANVHQTYNRYRTEINYFIKAVEQMYNLLSRNTTIVFVVSCGNRHWCESELVPWLEMDSRYEVVYAGEGSPEEDLALLSSCNHSIIDYGLYGLWAALMVNGSTIVHNVEKSPAVTFAKYSKNWIVIT